MTDFLNKVSDTVGGVISESKDFVDKGISSLIGGSSDRSQNGGFNAQNILSNLSQQGVAHSSHFEVQVIWNNSPSPNLQYRAESAELPASCKATEEEAPTATSTVDDAAGAGMAPASSAEGDGNIVELRCTYDPETAGGQAPDGRKVKATIQRISPSCHSIA